MFKPLPPSAVLADIVCDNIDGDVMHDLQSSSGTVDVDLRLLVDIVWQHATESTAVPFTKTADMLIAKYRQCFPSAAQQQPADFLHLAEELRKSAHNDDPGMCRVVMNATAQTLQAMSGAAQAAQEPVAWLYETWCGEDHWSQRYSDAKPAGNKWERNIRPLYLAPPTLTLRLVQQFREALREEGYEIVPIDAAQVKRK